MKTLYININGEDIQSNADRHVVGRPEDALINAFYYELGNEILNGVPGVSKISKRDLVLEFKTHNKDRFDKILDQWTALKKIVLGPNPSGQFGVELPDEYVKWLQDKSDRVYRAIAMSLVNRGRKVNISIDNIYEAIELLLDSIDPDDCSDCEQFVVNDELVIGQSRLVRDFKNLHGEELAFIQYSEFQNQKSKESHTQEDVDLKRSKSDNGFYAKVKIEHYNEEIAEFYLSEGKKLTDSEYYIIASSENVSNHLKKHLLVMKTKGDSNLYFITSDGQFHLIGSYDLEEGYRIGKTYSLKKWWRFAAKIIDDKFILYRSNRDYKLFEICSDSTIRLVSEFSSKAILWDYLYIVGDCIVSWDGFTICYKDGKHLKANGYQYSCLIGYIDSTPVFIASNDNNWFHTELNGSKIVNQQGKCLWDFNYNEVEVLPNNLLLVYTGKRYGKHFGLFSITGKCLLKCKYEDIEQIDNDIFRIKREEETKFFVLSKERIVDYVGNNFYVVFNGEKQASIYRRKDDSLINTFSLTKDAFDYLESFLEDSFEKGLKIDIIPNGNDIELELYSINKNKVIYRFNSVISEENLIGMSNNMFGVEGVSYVEFYDSEGNLIKKFDHDGKENNFHLWPNGFVSFNKTGDKSCYFYDRLWNLHHISSQSYTSRGWSTSCIWIEKFLSDNCILIHDVTCKGKADHSNCFLVNSKGKPIFDLEFDDIDGNNHLVSYDNIEIIDNNHCYCRILWRSQGSYLELCTIIDTQKGMIAVKPYNKYDCIYLIK